MFAVTKFESNNDADSVCKQLFANGARYSEKIKHGKVTKKTKKKKLINQGKIKDEIKNIWNPDFPTNVIKKKRKQNQNIERTSSDKHQTTKVFTATELSNEAVNKKRKKKRKKKKEDKEANTTELSPQKRKDAVVVNKEENLKEKQAKRKKNKKKKHQMEIVTNETTPQENSQSSLDNHNKKNRKKLKQKLQETPISQSSSSKKQTKNLTLRQRMMAKLQAARFRYLNEQIYSTDSKEAQKIFKEDPEAFTAYHEGYRKQVEKWPLNPVDVIIQSIRKLPKSHIIADFGCGDAKIAQSVPQKVHSFDLVAANEMVVACDMAHVSLQNSSVDVVVFCLSLMGTNIQDYLLEANRVLKPGGILKVAEVESRFDDVNQFIEALKRFNFKNTWTDLSHNLFYFLDFKKEANITNKKKLPTVSLHPCLYKKR